MKHSSCHILRPAIAMIELIFAIVIMGIILMSAPNLIQTATQSVSVALQQEAINEAVSRVNMVLTYPWDENDTNSSCTPPVLYTGSAETELNPVSGTPRRIGVPTFSKSRTFKCGTSDFNASSLGSDAGDRDDIDDFGATATLSNLGGAGGEDYIETATVSMTTSIKYIADTNNYATNSITYNFPSATINTYTTSIKAIQVVLISTSTATELTKTITLNAFSCNIGGYDYEKREF